MNISPTHLEIDKLDNCWVLTLLLNARGPSLRLKMVQRAKDCRWMKMSLRKHLIRVLH
jgi:hypothetical protein